MSRELSLRRLVALWSVIGAAVLGATALTVAAAADDDAADDDAAVAKACLFQNELKRTKVLDGRNILFVTRDGQTYNNQLPRECPSMRRGSLLNYAFESRRICAGNTFQVLWVFGYNRVPTFICPLGMFVPISEDEAEDLIALTEEHGSGRRQRRPERDMVQTEPVELPDKEAADSAH